MKIKGILGPEAMGRQGLDLLGAIHYSKAPDSRHPTTHVLAREIRNLTQPMEDIQKTMADKNIMKDINIEITITKLIRECQKESTTNGQDKVTKTNIPVPIIETDPKIIVMHTKVHLVSIKMSSLRVAMSTVWET